MISSLLYDRENMNSETIIAELIIESSNKLRRMLELEDKDLINWALPKFVTRKDPSLDNYFGELLLRTCYRPTRKANEFEEIIIRGSDQELPTNLNPQIRNAILIGIGGRSKNKDFIAAYDEHSFEGTRKADSASQIVFFRHLNKFKKSKPGVRSIIPVLNHINEIDSQGRSGPNHIINVTKTLHHSLFQRPGFVVEEFPAQWKRAVIQSILAAICLEQKYLWSVDIGAITKRYREVWQLYFNRRERAVQDGYLPAISKDILGTVLTISGAANPKNEPRNHIFSINRSLAALEKVWGEEVAIFVIGFLMESMLQGQDEYGRIIKMEMDETAIPETGCSLIYYQMAPNDLMPHRAIGRRIKDSGKNTILIIKDLQRNTMAIFGGSLPKNQWRQFVDWLQTKEPDHWYVPVNTDTNEIAVFILNGTRSYLGSEPTSLKKEDFIEGIKEALV